MKKRQEKQLLWVSTGLVALVTLVPIWNNRADVAIALGITLSFLLITLAIKRSVRVIKKYQDNIFDQFQAYHRLHKILDPVKPLPDMRRYAGSPDFLCWVNMLIEEQSPEVIVEASSGISTLTCGYSLKKLGKGQVISLEHDGHFREISQGNVKSYGLADIAHVFHAPLVTHKINGESWLWYDTNATQLPEVIDMIVIDGPPKRTQAQARYPALPLLIERLKVGGVLILDDAARKSEKSVVKRWEQEFKNIEVSHLPSERGTTVITKTSI